MGAREGTVAQGEAGDGGGAETQRGGEEEEGVCGRGRGRTSEAREQDDAVPFVVLITVLAVLATPPTGCRLKSRQQVQPSGLRPPQPSRRTPIPPPARPLLFELSTGQQRHPFTSSVYLLRPLIHGRRPSARTRQSRWLPARIHRSLGSPLTAVVHLRSLRLWWLAPRPRAPGAPVPRLRRDAFDARTWQCDGAACAVRERDGFDAAPAAESAVHAAAVWEVEIEGLGAWEEEWVAAWEWEWKWWGWGREATAGIEWEFEWEWTGGTWAWVEAGE